jgi:hypothetical protein
MFYANNSALHCEFAVIDRTETLFFRVVSLFVRTVDRIRDRICNLLRRLKFATNAVCTSAETDCGTLRT